MKQRGYVINLLLTLAVGAIAYAVTLVKDRPYALPYPANWCFRAGFGLTVFSVALGIVASLTRLRDYRLTTRVARRRYDGKTDADLTSLRAAAAKYGGFTRRLATAQVIGFGLGILSFSAGLLLMNWDKF